MTDSTSNFRTAMRGAGLDYSGPLVADGKLHRFKVEGDKARNSWFVLFAGPPLAGAYGCWKRGPKDTWCEKQPKDCTVAQWRKIQAQWKQADIERERAERVRHEKASEVAARIFNRAKPAQSHPYLVRKGVRPHGELRERYDGCLVVPLRDAAGTLTTLEFIAPDKRFGIDGEKRDKTFLTGGRKAGSWFTLCYRPDGPLVIAEGFATGASIHEATGYAVACAMDCGNLEAVAKSIRAKYPVRDIIIAADDDRATGGNPGLTKATSAANAIGARLAVPRFKDTASAATDFNDLALTQGCESVKDQIEKATTPAETDWPELKPLPADMPAVPAFDFAWLPSTFGPWIKDITERMQCPPDFPAVGLMVALGSLIGRKVGIRPKQQDDWLVVPNVWGCVVGRPGLMKTPALEQPLLPLRRLVAEAGERYAAAMQEHEVDSMIDAQQAKVAEKRIAGHLKRGDQQSARAEAVAIVKKEANKPICRRYETNDPTIEKLGMLLAENPMGLLLFRDEMSGFLRGLDREGHESDRATYLEMWNGTGPFTSDRIQRGTTSTPAVLSLLGGIQPDLLVTYIREAVRGGEGADGLLQRIQLFVWPDVSKEWHHVDRWPNTEAKNEAFAVFKYLDNLTADTVGADTSSGIPFLRFTGDAQEQFNLWRAQLERTIRGGTEHPAFEAHLSKYKKLVPALALIIHLADRDTGPVTLAALDKALLWAKYLESHARRIYSAVLRPDAAAARELAKHLQRGDLPGRFTLREAYYRGWAGLSDKEDAEAATEILCELGWIRPAAKVERTTGRPTGPVFESNPKIYGLLQNEPAKPQNNIALNGDQKITATPPERTRKTAKATSNGFAAPPVQEVAQSTIGGGLGAGKMSAEQAKELDITEADKQEAMAL